MASRIFLTVEGVAAAKLVLRERLQIVLAVWLMGTIATLAHNVTSYHLAFCGADRKLASGQRSTTTRPRDDQDCEGKSDSIQHAHLQATQDVERHKCRL